MSVLAPIDARAAQPAQTPIDADLSWVCPTCGKIRMFEGGRLECGARNECSNCGSRLADLREPSLASAKGRVRTLNDCAMW